MSPVPITMPPSLLARSIRIWVLSRAWEFSYVASCTDGSWSMSLKCCSTAGPIGISIPVTPRAFIRSHALFLVRDVVPNPGIVTPMISLRERPVLSNARAATSRASVLSRPPDMPMITVLQLMWDILLARAETCIASASRHPASISAFGRNGDGSTYLWNSFSKSVSAVNPRSRQ